MGKQSKRKTRRGRSSQQSGNGQKRQKSEQGNTVEGFWRPRVDLSKASKRDRNVILKIRHGDARVRDGALSALSATLFSGSGGSQVSNEVLQAIAERLAIDSDIPSSCAAAGCLVNFLESSDENCQRMLHQVPHVNMLYILSNRIARTLDNAGEDGVRKPNAEWNVTFLCLQILVTLVESGFCSNSHGFVDAHQFSQSREPQSLLQVVVQTFLRGAELLESKGSQKSSGSLEDMDLNKKTRDTTSIASEEIDIAIKRSVELSSRFLHSVLDSCNDEDDGKPESNLIALHAVALSIPLHNTSEVSSGNVSTIHLLQKLITENGQEWISPKASLHAAGALVSLRASLLHTDAEGNAASNLDSIVMDVVLPYLSDVVKNTFNTQTAQESSQKVFETEAELRRETDDLALESKVERAVKQRNEPARLIARRQKQEKEEKEKIQKKEAEANKVSDSEMGDSPEEQKADVKLEYDAKQEYDSAVDAWMSYTLPLLLGLEVLANLTSCSGSRQNLVDDDEEMAWASDDEDNMEVMAVINSPDENENSGALPTLLTTKDEALLEKVAAIGIPEQILSLLESTLAFSGHKDDDSSEKSSQMSDIVLRNVGEMKSKSSACLGNILTNMAQQLWRPSKEESLDLWTRFMNILRKELLAFSKFAGAESDVDVYDHINSLSRTLLALMQTRGHLIAESVSEADLELLLMTLSNSNEGILDCRQNIVVVLGELCSKPHSNNVNELICKALLSALKDTPGARCSLDNLIFFARVLDVLIDMYADDDAYRDIFVSQGVLKAFEVAHPTLRRGIKELSNKEVDEEEKSYLRKTSLNVSQFIKYKRDKQIK